MLPNWNPRSWPSPARPFSWRSRCSWPRRREQIDDAAFLDAGANRAREALRMLEDYCRFCLDDALLSRELKQAAARPGRPPWTALPADLLLEARETLRDVGTAISTRRRARAALAARRRARPTSSACRRRCAAWRSSASCSARDLGGSGWSSCATAATRWSGPCSSAATARRAAGRAPRLYVLLTGSAVQRRRWTGPSRRRRPAGRTSSSCARRTLSDRELLERARDVRRWTRQAGVLFIVNDRPDIARLVEADGVHLGQDDLPVKEARRIVGPDAADRRQHARPRAGAAGGARRGRATLGVGPTFPSAPRSSRSCPGWISSARRRRRRRCRCSSSAASVRRRCPRRWRRGPGALPSARPSVRPTTRAGGRRAAGRSSVGQEREA